ncbi:MAG: hypothetical protein HQK81_13165 [Desulfovibrionaceae bacterium]|nr:hypothetical protein [Desulfovibrionaceae bacterium]MBF0514995.1 hypothetical protein [Desulfovibrionaceae bacterium]
MKRCILFSTLSFLLLAASFAWAAAAGEEQGQFTIETHHAKAQIESIDLAAMTSKLKLEDGKEIEVKLDPKVKNLDQVHPGDAVDVRRTTSLLLYLMKEGEDAQSYKLKDVTYDTTPHGKPVKYTVETHVTSAVVENYDKKGGYITLAGVDGKTLKYKLTRPVKGFSEVKKGDRIFARYTETVMVMVKPKRVK